jgi:hypothetical protein
MERKLAEVEVAKEQLEQELRQLAQTYNQLL